MRNSETINQTSNLALTTLFLLSFFLPTDALAEDFASEILQSMQDQKDHEARVERENWARIVTSGGKIFSTRDVYGCVSMEDYGDIMSFILYGTGAMPSPDKCWKLENGTHVQLTNASFPMCNDTQTICKFEETGLSGLISSPFYTTVFAILGE